MAQQSRSLVVNLRDLNDLACQMLTLAVFLGGSEGANCTRAEGVILDEPKFLTCCVEALHALGQFSIATCRGLRNHGLRTAGCTFAPLRQGNAFAWLNSF